MSRGSSRLAARRSTPPPLPDVVWISQDGVVARAIGATLSLDGKPPWRPYRAAGPPDLPRSADNAGRARPTGPAGTTHKEHTL